MTTDDRSAGTGREGRPRPSVAAGTSCIGARRAAGERSIETDVAAVLGIEAVPTILEVICRTTGMGFAAIARVTEDRWVACGVRDEIAFGLEPGGELEVETTICDEVRRAREPTLISNAADDPVFCHHPAPARYGFQSYISMPITLPDGTFFGTLCAIDPRPHRLDTPEILGLFKMFAQLVAFHIDAHDRSVESRKTQVLNETLARHVEERTAERDLLANIVESTDVMVMACTFDFRIVAMNTALAVEFERVYGVLPCVGDNLLGLLSGHPEHRAQVKAAWDIGFAGEDVNIVEDYGDPVRDRPYYEIKFRSLRDEHGRRTGSYQFVTDVTDRLRDQAKLTAAEAALRQSQKMEAVGQLTGGLAHDFNNLLTGIIGSLELLQARIAQGRSGDIERYVAAAQGAAKRAASLTHRLLAFSRRQTLDPKPTDVNRLVAGMQELLARTMGPEIAIEPAAGIGLWPVLVDPSQLENALLNLCINSRDAMPNGGKLSIETSNRWIDERGARERDLPAGQYVSLCVSDDGSGMAREVVARAFDPFFTTKPLGMGTGLGLSMVYGFARQSGGQVRIYSEVGQGTTVCIYLPRHAGDVKPDETGAGLPEAPRVNRDKTVLVVDDEATIRMLVAEVLEDLGCSPMVAADGAAAMEVLRSDARIDLLITDVGLPGGLNGRQVADAARATRPDLKVLFITGYAENAVINHGHLDQGMHVMTKPFAMDDLASRVKELIRS